MASRFLAVDVGASRLKIGVFEGLNMVRRVELETPKTGGPLAVARAILDNVGSEKFESVGVASIGPLDLEKGWVVNTPNNPLKSFALREPLLEAFKTTVIVANDCMAAVWGEHVLGGGIGAGDLAYVTISTGIGVGVIVDGRLLVGRRGNAHEAGHIVVDVNSSVKCGCGGIGHWEALASGANIPQVASLKAREWGGDSGAWRLALEGSLSPEKLYNMARAGDPFAARLVDYINKVHASGIASIIAAYDPEVIFIGGSIYLNNEDLILEGILKYIREYSLLEPPPIRRATFGGDSVLYGALAVALNPPRELKRYLKGA